MPQKEKGKLKNKRWQTLKISVAVVCGMVIAACVSSKFNFEGETFRKDNVAMDRRFQFKDLHGEQLYAAKKYGITPIETRKKLRRNHRRLKKIWNTKYYIIDPLTHSSPYLTKGAKSLLKDIAQRFQHKLKKGGYREHRIIVTSLLRTREDVGKLRQVNGAASRNSSHMYGTSFDLSYTRFNRISMSGKPISNDVMCNLLGETIYELREAGDCWAIFERNQHCIHVTARR